MTPLAKSDKAFISMPSQGTLGAANAVASGVSARGLIFLALLVFTAFWTRPKHLFSDTVTSERVFYFGLITALSTGLGALPFAFISMPSQGTLGAANAVASGMMMSASVGLLVEGCYGIEGSLEGFSAVQRTFAGAVAGGLFILAAKRVLEHHEDVVSMDNLSSLSSKKVLLVVFVMTLHSFSEGVGIGVSFAGENSLGVFISLSLAVHNIPEGLAVALVMVPRGVSVLDTFLWAIFTSLPQPLTAVPAFQFVEQFEPFLPLGLGFAAGAMLLVAVVELLPDAVKDLHPALALAITTVAFGAMGMLQWEIHGVI